MTRGRGLPLGGLLLVAMVWLGATPGSAVQAQVDPGEEVVLVEAELVAQLEALLELRVSEVTTGSGNGTLHADASTELEQRWRRTTAGFAQVGLASYNEQLQLPVLDLTPPGLAASDGSPALVVEVIRRWQVEGVDTHEAKESLFVAVAADPVAGGQLRVLDDDALRSVGVTSARALWEVTDVAVHRTDGPVIVGAASTTARMTEVGALLTQARARLGSLTVPDRYLVIVPDGARQAKDFMQTPLDVSKFVAFVSFSIDRDDGWSAGPPRLVLQEGNLARRSTTRQVSILAHELVHVAGLTDAGPLTPLWVHEGFADWEANGRVAVDPGGLLEIPEAHTFRAGSVSEIVAAYDRSESLFARLAQIGDDSSPGRFFAEVGSVRSSAGTVEYHVERGLLALGLDRDRLEGRGPGEGG